MRLEVGRWVLAPAGKTMLESRLCKFAIDWWELSGSPPARGRQERAGEL